MAFAPMRLPEPFDRPDFIFEFHPRTEARWFRALAHIEGHR